MEELSRAERTELVLLLLHLRLAVFERVQHVTKKKLKLKHRFQLISRRAVLLAPAFDQRNIDHPSTLSRRMLNGRGTHSNNIPFGGSSPSRGMQHFQQRCDEPIKTWRGGNKIMSLITEKTTGSKDDRFLNN